MTTADATLASTVREHTGRLVASLAGWCGNLDVAEEAVADAVELALRDWRAGGVPEHPDAWLHTVARRRAVDRLRRIRRYTDKLQALNGEPSAPRPYDHGDERLGLLFACCHPALGRPAQIALTLRAVIGLTTAEIARAFLSTEPTIAQRITRAKRKIVAAPIPLAVPPQERMQERLDHVLTVLYLTYNEGHLATGGRQGSRRDLAEDAIWLTRLVDSLIPDEPELLGLLALLLLSHARDPARWADDGRLVRLEDQDRARWDRRAIAEGTALLERAGAMRRPGRYQLQGAIAAVHAEAAEYGSTDWPQVVALYDLLVRYDGSPVVLLNRAVAAAHVSGPDAALAEVEALDGRLAHYHLFHAVRGYLLGQLGRPDEARAANERALELTTNAAERAVLTARLASS